MGIFSRSHCRSGTTKFLGLTVEVVQQKCPFLKREKHELALLVMYTEFEY